MSGQPLFVVRTRIKLNKNDWGPMVHRAEWQLSTPSTFARGDPQSYHIITTDNRMKLLGPHARPPTGEYEGGQGAGDACEPVPLEVNYCKSSGATSTKGDQWPWRGASISIPPFGPGWVVLMLSVVATI